MLPDLTYRPPNLLVSIGVDESLRGSLPGGLTERPMVADCKSAGFPYGGSNPSPATESFFAAAAAERFFLVIRLTERAK